MHNFLQVYRVQKATPAIGENEVVIQSYLAIDDSASLSRHHYVQACHCSNVHAIRITFRDRH